MIDFITSRLTRAKWRALVSILVLSSTVCSLNVASFYHRGVKKSFLQTLFFFADDAVVTQRSTDRSLVPTLPQELGSKIERMGSIRHAVPLRVVESATHYEFHIPIEHSRVTTDMILEGTVAQPGKSQILLGTTLNKREGSFGSDPERFAGVYRTNNPLLDASSIHALDQEFSNASFFILTPHPAISASSALATVESQFPQLEAVTIQNYVSSLDLIKNLSRIEEFLLIILLFFIVLSASISLPLAVGERRNELYLLRALGWRRQLIFTSTALEVAALLLLGVLLGSILSLLLVHIPGTSFTHYLRFGHALYPYIHTAALAGLCYSIVLCLAVLCYAFLVPSTRAKVV